MSDFNINFSNIDEAYKRIKGEILKTPLVTSEYINQLINLTKLTECFKLVNQLIN